jgi:hypothetical protein
MAYSFTRRSLHVAPLKGDPLPDAWRGLPPVEILPPIDADQDAWYLPEVRNLLHLPLAPAATTDKPVKSRPQLQLLVNMTPSERSFNTAGSLRRNMAAIIPSLKVLSALNAKVQPPSVAMLDVTHLRAAYETPNAATLDWAALSKVLSENQPGVIDAKSLAKQATMRDYLAGELARRAARLGDNAGPPRWLIVLSGPLVLGKQEETPLPELPPDAGRHIVYLRFSPFYGGAPRGGLMESAPEVRLAPASRVHGPLPGFGIAPGGLGRGRGPNDGAYGDELERILKPMGAQVIDVSTPVAFRKILAALVTEISAN